MRKPLRSFGALFQEPPEFVEERPTAPGVRKVDFGSLPPPSKKKAGKKNFTRAFEAACADAKARMARRGDPKAWEGADAATLVGAYAVLHEQIYKVRAEELTEEFLAARSSADRCLRELGTQKTVAMIQWKWAKIRRQVNEDGSSEFRLGWKLMFSKRMISDFRVARGSE